MASTLSASWNIDNLSIRVDMKKEQYEVQLEEGFADFASEYPQSALVLVTGLFVGLLEFLVKDQGGDETLEIKIDGNGKRDITVHAVSSEG